MDFIFNYLHHYPAALYTVHSQDFMDGIWTSSWGNPFVQLPYELQVQALLSEGLPTVQYFADALNISAKYLSSLLKQLTGQTMQQIIHEKLIEKAKEKLSTTRMSVSEIAYQLGFEHPQSFNKLFKSQTKQSPLNFRQSFN